MSTASKTRSLGNAGEIAVALYLIQDGFTIIARNYTIRGGEIDIIATKGELVVFVEVKTRTSHTFALSQVITPSKQKKIIFAARHYLLMHPQPNKVYRFDVALVEGADQAIIYLPHAFNSNDY